MPIPHPWDVDIDAARALQAELAARVDDRTPLPPIRTVAGADISYDRGSDVLYAAVVVVDVATMAAVATASHVGQATFPYVPGYLSFREAPSILAAFAKLPVRPDALLADGQGKAHPRRFGVACHLGLWLDLPAVGCGKSRLYGKYDEPGPGRGDRSPLVGAQGEVVGTVLRTRRGVKPVFVSVGHRADLATAEELVLRLSPKYRVPIPTRLAHVEVNRLRREAGA